MKPLPTRQQEILDFLRRRIRETGFVPSIREIGEALGLQSTSTIHYHLTGLSQRGLIRWEKGKNRAIQLIGESESPAAVDSPRALPIAGRIAAGNPIEGIADGSESLDIGELWAQPGNFLLEVTGESMIEDHIAPGDYVVVRPQSTARNGEIVVALVDGSESTLKRFYKESGRIRLQPANSAMEPIYSEQVQIQGRVVGVIRQVH